MYEGRQHVIVPVVMMRSDVVMNEGLVPQDELMPESWNGTVVTVHHPTEGGSFVTANTPTTLTEWSVGKIFNAHVDGTKLKAEAWVEVQRANEVAPGLVAALKRGENIDVSVGFFSKDEEQAGELNGRPYTRVNRDIKPDHLALLPGGVGACSWQDGCGVRANAKGYQMTANKLQRSLQGAFDMFRSALSVKGDNTVVVVPDDEAARAKMFHALRSALTSNARGSEDDRRQMMADLISNDASPFLPDDQDALSLMSQETLKKMRDDYLPPREDATEPATNGDRTMTANSGLPTSAAALQAMIDKAVAAGVEAALKANAAATADAISKAVEAATSKLMTNEQRAALDTAAKIAAEHRTSLITKITTNSAMTKEVVEKWDTPMLEVVANGLNPAPAANFGGRPVPHVAVEKDDPAAAAMTPPSTLSVIKTNKK